MIVLFRGNADGFDLNRSFPDFFEKNSQQMTRETEAIMMWLKKYKFVLSGALHGGAVVANYPYDNQRKCKSLLPDNGADNKV